MLKDRLLDGKHKQNSCFEHTTCNHLHIYSNTPRNNTPIPQGMHFALQQTTYTHVRELEN